MKLSIVSFVFLVGCAIETGDVNQTAINCPPDGCEPIEVEPEPTPEICEGIMLGINAPTCPMNDMRCRWLPSGQGAGCCHNSGYCCRAERGHPLRCRSGWPDWWWGI